MKRLLIVIGCIPLAYIAAYPLAHLSLWLWSPGMDLNGSGLRLVDGWALGHARSFSYLTGILAGWWIFGRAA